jgi:peptide/nickel transport system permease protein
MGRGGRLIRRRLLQAVPVILIVVVGAFLLMELAPGDAVDAYLAATGGGGAGFAERLRADWQLDQSAPARLVTYLVKLASLDLGWSVVFSRPVIEVIASRLPNTVLMMASALTLAAALGALMGAMAALRPGSPRDLLLSGAALVLNAMPNFWIALMAIVVFVVKLSWFPLGGIETIASTRTGLARAADIAWHLVLPVTALAITYLALYLRLMRAAMLQAAASDYVRTARAKGLSGRRIVWRHMARNALLPVVTMLGVQTSSLLGGSVVIETIFAIPGLGRLAYEAVSQRDLPLMMGIVFCSAILVLVVNLALDLLYARLDPRIEV